MMEDKQMALSLLQCFAKIRLAELRFNEIDDILSDISPHLHIRYIKNYESKIETDEKYQGLLASIRAIEKLP